jgi:hypothetical protein
MHGAQRHRVDRLVKQVVTVGVGLAQRSRIGIAADKESRNLGRKCPAQALDHVNARLTPAQIIIRDNQIGRPIMFCEPASAAFSVLPVTTSQPQFRNSPRMPSRTSGSSSMTTTSLRAD